MGHYPLGSFRCPYLVEGMGGVWTGIGKQGVFIQSTLTKGLRNACGVRSASTYRSSAIAPEATSAGAHTHAHLAVMTGRGAAKGTKSGEERLGTRVDAVAGAQHN